MAAHPSEFYFGSKDGVARAGHKTGDKAGCAASRSPRLCIWLTGLPASGKSTVAEALQKALEPHPTMILDGDEVRRWLTPDLGFNREDRRQNVLRVAQAAKRLVRGRSNVIVALVSPYESDRQKAMRVIRKWHPCLLVHLDCPVDVCEQRDPKGDYAKARAREILDFTGVDGVYERPETPDVLVRTDLLSVDEVVAEILKAVGSDG